MGKVVGENGADGKDGQDGKDGADGKDGTNGKDGTDGKDGADGIGIAKTEINAEGRLVITYSNGTTETLGVVVGANGQNGADGKDGVDGKDGMGYVYINARLWLTKHRLDGILFR